MLLCLRLPLRQRDMPTDFAPPFHPLERDAWKSDYMLSNQSAKKFHKLHRTVSTSLGRLDSEIARIQAILDQLLHERSLYVLRINRINAAVAPHKKMPAEILSQIFKYTIGGPIGIDLKRSRSWMWLKTYNMPVSAQISRRWREITLNTQIFWNRVKFTCFIGESTYSDGIIGTVQSIISRGSSCITLHLDDNLFYCPPKYPSLSALIHVLAGAKHIKLSTSSSWLFHKVLATSPPLFSVLESVDLSDSGSFPIDIEKCRMFNNAPRLVRVCIARNKGLVLTSQPSFELPWSQLQVVKISPISLSAAHYFLSWCPRLIHCALDIGGDSGQAPIPSPFPPGSIFLPNLITLTLRFITEPRLVPPTAPVLEPLVLPFLSTLSIFHPYDDTWHTAVTHLVNRSRCSLRRLVAYIKRLPVDMLVQMAWGLYFLDSRSSSAGLIDP